MTNGIERKIENHVKEAFDHGYNNAVSSLAQMVQGKIAYLSLQESLYRFNADPISALGFVNRSSEGVMITTEVFGDVFGKSYLLLSNQEFDIMTNGIYGDHHRAINLKDEFIKELDNILSAAVLTKLSNELKLKVYGDIPVLIKPFSGDMMNHIQDDFEEQCEEVYINSIVFTFENCTSIRPRFVWVMDNRIINALERKLTH